MRAARQFLRAARRTGGLQKGMRLIFVGLLLLLLFWGMTTSGQQSINYRHCWPNMPTAAQPPFYRQFLILWPSTCSSLFFKCILRILEYEHAILSII
jgi:hypothetical protein